MTIALAIVEDEIPIVLNGAAEFIERLEQFGEPPSHLPLPGL